VGRQGPATDLALLETARPIVAITGACFQEVSEGAPRSAVSLRHQRPSDAEFHAMGSIERRRGQDLPSPRVPQYTSGGNVHQGQADADEQPRTLVYPAGYSTGSPSLEAAEIHHHAATHRVAGAPVIVPEQTALIRAHKFTQYTLALALERRTQTLTVHIYIYNSLYILYIRNKE